MAEPKKKLSATRSGKRRSHLALSETSVALCANCGKPNLPHVVCKACGFYKGAQVLPKKK